MPDLSIYYPIADVIRATEHPAYIEVIVLCPYCKHHHSHALLEWATKMWYERRSCVAATHALKKMGLTQVGGYQYLAPRQPVS